MNEPIKLPCLRGRMGDWFYYVSLMSFKEIANRTSMVPDIHKNEELSRWIQREVINRTEDIVDYLLRQNQRFFNSIIFGIYGGKPQWQELDIDERVKHLTEEEREYFGRTFGILNLNGDEEIFAIDGQHRTKAIKDAVKKDSELEDEEVSVIFLAHKKTEEGEVRTRRLFSTLNRYAVPVSISEIIALDEDDNSAILTRFLMEEFDFFKNKIKFSKTRSISHQDNTHFTNIILLYDIVTIILTDKSFSNSVKLKGYELKNFITRRETEETLNKEFKKLKDYFFAVLNSIPSVKKYFKNGTLKRNSPSTSLIFRPIGQLIFFYILKIAGAKGKKKKALNFFTKESFHLSNPSWKKVFIDPETKTIRTDKPRQTLAIQLILQKLGIDVPMTKKEKELRETFEIDLRTL
jgi:DNA sulfur modification protein DndB